MEDSRNTAVRAHGKADAADDCLGFQFLRFRSLGAGTIICSKDEMRIVAAETEIADRRDTWPVIRPVLAPGRSHVRPCECLQHVAIKARWRDYAFIDRKARLDQAGKACGRDEMSEIALQRTDRETVDPCEVPRRRRQLNLVARWRAGGVRFDQAHIARWIETGHGPGGGHCFCLSAFIRGQKRLAPTVIGQADAPNYAMNTIRARTVCQALQDNRRSAFSRNETIGPRNKRPGPSCRTKCVECTEPLMQDQIIRPVHSSSDCYIE